MTFHVPEQFRLTHGPMGTDASYGRNGGFDLPGCIPGRRLFALASDDTEPGFEATDGGWEHVSVSGHRDRGTGTFTPTWDEMCYVKRLFWDAEDVVVQFHPRESEYVSFHDHCLHLWRATGAAFPTPDPERVGPLAQAESAGVR